MGMTILLDKLIYIPENVRKHITIEVNKNKQGWKIPEFNKKDLVSLNIRLGCYRGWTMAEFLQQYTSYDEYSTDWEFDYDTAQKLTEMIKEILEGNNEEHWMPEEAKDDSDFLVDLQEIKEILERELKAGTDWFSISLG